MDDATKRDLEAVGKILVGSGQIALGVATAAGHGIFSYVIGNHHITTSGLAVGKKAVDSGTKRVEEGWRDLNG